MVTLRERFAPAVMSRHTTYAESARVLERAGPRTWRCGAYLATEYVDRVLVRNVASEEVQEVRVRNRNGRFVLRLDLGAARRTAAGELFVPIGGLTLTPAVFAPQADYEVELRETAARVPALTIYHARVAA